MNMKEPVASRTYNRCNAGLNAYGSFGEDQNCFVDPRTPKLILLLVRPEKIPIGDPIILNSLIHHLNENSIYKVKVNDKDILRVCKFSKCQL